MARGPSWSAKAFNAREEAAERATLRSVVGGTFERSPVGTSIARDPGRSPGQGRGFWALLTGSGPVYTFTEQVVSGPRTLSPKSGGRSGSVLETKGKTGLSGRYARVYPEGRSYRLDYPFTRMPCGVMTIQFSWDINPVFGGGGTTADYWDILLYLGPTFSARSTVVHEHYGIESGFGSEFGADVYSIDCSTSGGLITAQGTLHRAPFGLPIVNYSVTIACVCGGSAVLIASEANEQFLFYGSG